MDPELDVYGQIDPLAVLDFGEVDAVLQESGDVQRSRSVDSLDSLENEYDEDPEEAYDYEPFRSNAAQSLFRQAATSGEFDTLMAAGTISSSKTYGIAALIVELCLEYPETAVMVVRAKRESLEDSTIPDFLSVLNPARLRKFNRSKLNLYLDNGSLIQFRSANEQADPTFLWLRGKKFDIGFVDECDGCSREFISAFQSRVGIKRKRSRLAVKPCPPLTFFACNPNIAWPKENYSLAVHAPQKLKEKRYYFQIFTIKDNAEHITEAKKAQWKRLMTPAMYRRFVEGSWDAMADLEQLFLFEDMDRCRPYIPPPPLPAYVDTTTGHEYPERPGKWKKYLGVDPARYGPDKCAFLIMDGPNIHRLEFHTSTSIPAVALRTKAIMAAEGITPDHVTIDADGLGAGVIDVLAEDHIFVNAHKGAATADDAAFYWEDPTNPASKINMDNAAFTFYNKRAQSHWETMQMLRAGKIGNFSADALGWQDDEMGNSVNLEENLRQDLASIHYLFAKGTKAILIEAKEDIKKRLHRSPDFADVLILAVQAYLNDQKKPSLEVFSL